MILFHSSEISDKTAILKDDELRHCIKVLRAKVGDEINLTDGRGLKYLSEITSINKREARLDIISSSHIDKRKAQLHIAIALTKNMSRFEWFLEKSVEMGIERVTPLLCDHSERKHFNLERCRKKVISAATQSLKYHFPVVDELQNIRTVIDDIVNEDILIAHYEEGQVHLADQLIIGQSYSMLIGPEGDFSSKELILIKEKGLKTINLSPYRLRTETAGIMACSIFNSENR